MKRFAGLLSIGVSLLLVGACHARQPVPEYRPAATIREIMQSMVDPNADNIWDSVGSVSNEAGVQELAPRTDEEWTAIRRSAVQLIEAPNLLLVPGRHAARPGEKAEDSSVELEPEEIEKRINADRAAFTNLAHALQDSATLILKAIEAKDVPAIIDAGETLDTACENCHLTYWYPNQNPAPKQ